MSKLLKIVLITSLLASVLAGCGGKVEENYIMTTVGEATRGTLLSPGFKYGFDNPNIVAAHKNVALVRDGNQIEFLTGIDIESKLDQVKGKRLIVLARKLYSPRIHFTADFFVAGGDTITVGEPYESEFPALLKTIEEENFKQVDMSRIGPSTSDLTDIFNTKFIVKNAKVGWEEVEWMGEAMMAFTLDLGRVRFFINKPSDQMALFLRALMKEELFFDGGVNYGDRPAASTRVYRERTKIAGPVEIDFLRYGGQVVLTPI